MKNAIENNEYIRNKKRVFDILKTKHFELELVGIDKMHNEDKQPMYHYTLTINDTTFNYFEGLGHEPMTEENKHDKIINALHCLLLDADTMNFFKSIDDFANEFGYTSISQTIKVFNACKEINDKLGQLFTKQELHELRENIQL